MKIGTAKRNVSTELPIHLSGFGNPNRKFTGKYDDIFVRATAISGDKTVIIVSADVLAFNKDILEETSTLITEKTGVPKEAILYNASHTHSAPQVSPTVNPGIGAYVKEYADFFYASVVDAAVEAYNDMEEGTLAYSVATVENIGVNRRLIVDGKYYFAPNFNGLINKEVTVLRAECGGKLKAIIMQYACHPSTIGEDLMTSDYPGYACALLEKENPGTNVQFLQGCAGNIRVRTVNPAGTGFGKASYDDVKNFGTILHNAVNASAGAPQITVSDAVSYCKDEFFISYQPKLSKQEYLEQANNAGSQTEKIAALKYYEEYETYPDGIGYSVQKITLGDSLVIFALEGEVCIEYDFNIKNLIPGKHVVVCGYSNGMPGYICTEQMYTEGGYEPVRSCMCYYVRGGFDPKTDALILSHVRKMI